MTRKSSSFIGNIVGWVTKSNRHVSERSKISSMLSPTDIPVPVQIKRPQQDFHFSNVFEQTGDYLDKNRQTRIISSQKKIESKNSVPDKKNYSTVKKPTVTNRMSDKNSTDDLQVKPKLQNNSTVSTVDHSFLHSTKPQNRSSLEINTKIESSTQTDKNEQIPISEAEQSPEQSFDSSTEKYETDKTNLIQDTSYKEKISYGSVEKKIIEEQDSMHVSLEPSLPQKLSHLHQHKVDYREENIITINIGRIEVRNENSDKQLPENSSLSKPELSLTDYLRRRNR